MTAIIDGQLVRSGVTQTAMGGTELMALRMIAWLDQGLLREFNIIHSRVEPWMLTNGKPTVLVLHDLPQDEASAWLKDPARRGQFAKIVCVSNWQMQMHNTVL